MMDDGGAESSPEAPHHYSTKVKLGREAKDTIPTGNSEPQRTHLEGKRSGEGSQGPTSPRGGAGFPGPLPPRLDIQAAGAEEAGFPSFPLSPPSSSPISSLGPTQNLPPTPQGLSIPTSRLTQESRLSVSALGRPGIHSQPFRLRKSSINQ